MGQARHAGEMGTEQDAGRPLCNGGSNVDKEDLHIDTTPTLTHIDSSLALNVDAEEHVSVFLIYEFLQGRIWLEGAI